jgi:hypothetical protein
LFGILRKPFDAVLRGLDPRIHVFVSGAKAWMAGSSPAKTKRGSRFPSFCRAKIFPGQPCAFAGMTVNYSIFNNYFLVGLSDQKNIGLPTSDNHRLTTAIALMRKKSNSDVRPHTRRRVKKTVTKQ